MDLQVEAYLEAFLEAYPGACQPGNQLVAAEPVHHSQRRWVAGVEAILLRAVREVATGYTASVACRAGWEVAGQIRLLLVDLGRGGAGGRRWGNHRELRGEVGRLLQEDSHRRVWVARWEGRGRRSWLLGLWVRFLALLDWRALLG